MGTDKRLIDFSALHDMLYGEEKYIREFANAAVLSFREFDEDYRKHLMARDETSFRKAGHKIKPVAQMLGVNPIVEEYEHGKTLLWDEKPDAELAASCDRIEAICSAVIEELEEIAESESE